MYGFFLLSCLVEFPVVARGNSFDARSVVTSNRISTQECHFEIIHPVILSCITLYYLKNEESAGC